MSAANDPDLLTEARRWMAADPDPATRAEVAALCDAEDLAGLRDRFGARIGFGTSGLRGPMGAGPNRMNRLVVRQVAAAASEVLQPAAAVVAHDARHNSAIFAADAAGVLAARGVRVWLADGPLPTPLTAFAVRHLGAGLGIMVTASHNPPGDNGCKVYGPDGAQLVYPHDARIERAMAASPLPGPSLAPAAEIAPLGREVVEAYLDAVVAEAGSGAGVAGLQVAYTPLHGVGWPVLGAALARWGCAAAVVDSQSRPDPDFPTIAYPNPEDPAALEEVLALGERIGADVALANDPDADRLAAAVRDRGRWRVLTGDEIGWVLAEHRLATTSGPGRMVATTAVSSSMLRAQAAHHRITYAETAPGFKWVVRAAERRPGSRLVFGYEEALGYAVNDVVRDKDGISAALVLLAAIARLRGVGTTVPALLEQLARRHGRHLTRQVTLRSDGPGATGRLRAAMDRLRTAPPGSIGGRAVRQVVDFLRPDTEMPPLDLLRFDLAGGGRVMLRPSGTEPRLKAYVEVVGPDEGPAAAALDELVSAVESLVAAAVDPSGS